MRNIYKYILSTIKKRKAAFFVLVDPDKIKIEDANATCHMIAEAGADGILVGGSLLFSNKFDEFVLEVKQKIDIPIIIFPGNSRQISEHADAILFLFFISSRNPNYLIGEQVIAAPIIRSMNLEAISTGYMHIESGNLTTVEFLSGSRSIPRNKVEIAVAEIDLFGSGQRGTSIYSERNDQPGCKLCFNSYCGWWRYKICLRS